MDRITVAKSAGFCYGVSRAVSKTFELCKTEDRIITLGDLIHNRQVIEELSQKGVSVCDDVEEIEEGSLVVIRAHGVGEAVIKRLEERNLRYIDLTCPFVKKIHKIVKEHYEKGYKIIIVGDKNHPEVIGINGWCNNEAFITYSIDDKFPEEFANNDVCIVAQTTINKNIFVQIVQNAKNTCQSTLIFDTICGATKERQEEAKSLAAQSDIMFVIGGAKSSNSQKLFEIAKSMCKESYFIENFEDIPQNIYLKKRKIGITAGASTPGSIIEEVFTTMDEKIKNEENFAELFEQYGSKTLNNGDIIDGTVVEVRGNEVIVDLGGFKYNGQLALDQLTDDPYQKTTDLVKEGDTITVYVVGVNDAEGKVVLSRKKLVAMESWNKIKAAYDNGDVLTAKIVKVVKGGVVALAESYQIFVPAKQIALRYIQDLESLLNTEIDVKLIDIDEKRKRVVGSARVLLAAQKQEVEDKFWAECEVGKEYTGAVKSLTSFGAFVDLGGVDGLVHISELSWNKIKHPSEVVKEGDVLTVYVKDINAETKKISLGFKKAEDNPWVIAQNTLHVDDVVKCTIVRIMPFGAFAQIMPNIDGLIHISQIADRRIDKPEDVLTIGDEVEAKITEINWETRKISLSIRALIAPVVKEEVKEEPVEEIPADEVVPVDIEKFIAEEAAAEAAEEVVEEPAVEEVAEETTDAE
ncbi:MAG: bifunctional 4-hydroxy-3-methylbut-2-enyl diphosphate reductase/30S ribosomal protein S1 [Clostridia bacterium]|nr:bifunctional 4-hydroxy-3-methylbut-2-enyl diphosphate reductase/30S ribosomal protein S1 [Clostridia bacterium]